MRRTLQILMGLCLGLATVVMSSPPPTPALAGRTLVVDDDMTCKGAQYSTIQDALVDAASGATIKVCPGSYEGPVLIDSKPGLKLIAQKGGPVILSAPVDFDGAILEVDNSAKVKIQGFTIDGAENFLPAATTIQGILFVNSSGTITKNTVSRIREPGLGTDNTLGQGILVLEANGPVTITSNTVTDFQALGIEVYGASRPPTISKNITAADSSQGTNPVGITLDHTPGGKILRNIVSSNWSVDNDIYAEGIVLLNTSKATVSGNTVTSYLMAFRMYSYCFADDITQVVTKNKVSGNKMYNNEVGLSLSARDDGSSICTSTVTNNRITGNKLYAPADLPPDYAGIYLFADVDQVVRANMFSGNTISGYIDASIVAGGDAFVEDQDIKKNNHVLGVPLPPKDYPAWQTRSTLEKLNR